jgi:hypothetical protein
MVLKFFDRFSSIMKISVHDSACPKSLISRHARHAAIFMVFNRMASENKVEIIKQAAFLRGAIITSFAQVEFLLADLAVKCQRFPEYESMLAKFPYKLEDRMKAIQRLLEVPGPLAAYRKEAEPLIAKIIDYEELRHFLAHGLLMMKTFEGGHILEYRMYRPAGKEKLEIGFLGTDTHQLENNSIEIAAYTQSVVVLFRKIYLEQKIEKN